MADWLLLHLANARWSGRVQAKKTRVKATKFRKFSTNFKGDGNEDRIPLNENLVQI